MFKNTYPPGFLSPEWDSIQNICIGPAQAEFSEPKWPLQPRKAKPKIENTKAIGCET